MNTVAEVKNHLEYLGYEVDYGQDDNNLLFCSKQGYPPLMIRHSENRMQFTGTYTINEIAKNDPVEFLKYLNALNIATSVTTFYISNEGNFYFSAPYIGIYSKKHFAFFLYLWESDIGETLDKVPNTERFLGCLDNLAQESHIKNADAYA